MWMFDFINPISNFWKWFKDICILVWIDHSKKHIISLDESTEIIKYINTHRNKLSKHWVPPQISNAILEVEWNRMVPLYNDNAKELIYKIYVNHKINKWVYSPWKSDKENKILEKIYWY